MNKEELIFKEYIEPQIIEPLATQELRAAIVPISCVRLFDSTMLRSVLSAADPVNFGEWNNDRFGDLLLQFKMTQLLVWEKGYAIDSDVRRMIAGYLRKSRPEVHRASNEAALGVYRSWLGRNVDNRNLFVVEEVFHLAALGRQNLLTRQMQSRVGDYPKYIRDEVALRAAYESLGEELARDEELASMTEKMPALIGVVDSVLTKLDGS